MDPFQWPSEDNSESRLRFDDGGRVLTRVRGHVSDKTLVIPEGVEEIGPYAFCYFTDVERVLLPSTLKRIGKHAFALCLNLKTLQLPAALEAIEPGAFFCCQCAITSLSEKFTSLQGMLYTADMRRLIYCSAKVAHAIIPEGVEIIDSDAFAEGENLLSVSLPESVRALPRNAFLNCYRLRSVSLPGALSSVRRVRLLRLQQLREHSFARKRQIDWR